MSGIWGYLTVFVASMAVDMVPVFAPPAWTVMVFFLLKFDLNPWIVLVLGVTGSTLGRYFFSLYVPRVSNKLIKRRKNEELEFVGKKLGGKLWRTWTFVFIYTLTPLSTTALFTAAGLGRVKPINTLPPFFAGKFISDAIMILTGRYLAGNAGDLWHNLLSPKSLITLALGLIVLGAVLFLDWRELLTRKKFKFRFRIWR